MPEDYHQREGPENPAHEPLERDCTITANAVTLISSDCPLTVHASVNILAAPQTNGLACRFLQKAEVEGLPWTSCLPVFLIM